MGPYSSHTVGHACVQILEKPEAAWGSLKQGPSWGRRPRATHGPGRSRPVTGGPGGRAGHHCLQQPVPGAHPGAAPADPAIYNCGSTRQPHKQQQLTAARVPGADAHARGVGPEKGRAPGCAGRPVDPTPGSGAAGFSGGRSCGPQARTQWRKGLGCPALPPVGGSSASPIRGCHVPHPKLNPGPW